MEKTIFLILTLIVPFATGAFAESDSKKDLCKDNGGDWEDGSCDFKTDDEDKADRFLGNVQAKEDFEDDKAALEDDLCDDPDANFDICQSATLAFASSDTEDSCKDNDGEWKDDSCHFYTDNKGWEVDEDKFYKESCAGKDEEDGEECIKHKESIEDGDE